MASTMEGGFHNDTTYPGFSWHVVGDPERLGAARQALATKKHARGKTAIKWDDEAVRETDDGGNIAWKELVILKAAHAWFMRVFESLERATGDKKSKPGLTGKSASGQRPWMLVPHPRGFDTELVRQQREAWGFGPEDGGEEGGGHRGEGEGGGFNIVEGADTSGTWSRALWPLKSSSGCRRIPT